MRDQARADAERVEGAFDDFVTEYNTERPHQALNMQCPAECYTASPRPHKGLPDLDYTFHEKTVTVTICGRICFNRRKINLSQVFAGQKVGIKQVSDRIWLVTFMDYDLGYFDDMEWRMKPLENPFGRKVFTHVSGIIRNPCLRYRPRIDGAPYGNRTRLCNVKGCRPNR
jgi:hypothetical protein